MVAIKRMIRMSFLTAVCSSEWLMTSTTILNNDVEFVSSRPVGVITFFIIFYYFFFPYERRL